MGINTRFFVGLHAINPPKCSAGKGFRFFFFLCDDRINIKLIPPLKKSVVYLCHQKAISSGPAKRALRNKEFSYGKQSLEVDCFYSGPFFFPSCSLFSLVPIFPGSLSLAALFPPVLFLSLRLLHTVIQLSLKTEIREQVADSASYM